MEYLMRGSRLEVEVSTSQLLQTLDSCLESASQGQPHIITKDGEEYAAVISMPEYAQLQYYLRLLDSTASQLLQEAEDKALDSEELLRNQSSPQDSSRPLGTPEEGVANEDCRQTNRTSPPIRHQKSFISSVLHRLSRLFR
ncbi:MAG: type II toxin-antitoxin system prevent-host-death family antitoxin [Moorea sp. SIO2I5]|nr:type II toxin-antitoxin system prevent-host-death family antitoxin [Moorena sp. SIO2I5]